MNLRKHQQAKDETTAPEILASLAESQDPLVRKYVANNPNTPLDSLQELGAEFPEAVVRNPIFTLLRLENPESKFVLLSLARSVATSPAILEAMVTLITIDKQSCLTKKAEDLELVLELFYNPNTPVLCKGKLALSCSGWHHIGVASTTQVKNCNCEACLIFGKRSRRSPKVI